MARVKRGVIAGRRHKKVLKKAKGYYNARRKVFRVAKQAVIKAGQYAYVGRRAEEARLPRAVDPAHQCGCPRLRALVQPVHRRRPGGRHRDRPQGPRRHRRARHRGVRRDRGEGEGGTGREVAPTPGGRVKDLESLVAGTLAEIGSSADLAALDAVRVAVLGKKGSVTELLKGLGQPPGRRAQVGRRRHQRGQGPHRRRRSMRGAPRSRPQCSIASSRAARST